MAVLESRFLASSEEARANAAAMASQVADLRQRRAEALSLRYGGLERVPERPPPEGVEGFRRVRAPAADRHSCWVMALAANTYRPKMVENQCGSSDIIQSTDMKKMVTA